MTNDSKTPSVAELVEWLGEIGNKQIAAADAYKSSHGMLSLEACDKMHGEGLRFVSAADTLTRLERRCAEMEPRNCVARAPKGEDVPIDDQSPCASCTAGGFSKTPPARIVCDLCVTCAEAAIDELTAENERLKAELQLVSSPRESVGAVVSELRARIATLEAENERLKAERDNAVATLESRERMIDSALVARIATLEAALSERDRLLRELVECDAKRKAARDSVAVVADAHAAEATYEGIIARARQLLERKS